MVGRGCCAGGGETVAPARGSSLGAGRVEPLPCPWLKQADVCTVMCWRDGGVARRVLVWGWWCLKLGFLKGFDDVTSVCSGMSYARDMTYSLLTAVKYRILGA